MRFLTSGGKKHVTESGAVENLAALRRMMMMMTDDTAMDEIILLLLRVRGQKDTGLRVLPSLLVFSFFLSLSLCVVRALQQLPCCAALLPPLSVSLSTAFLLRHSRWVVAVVVAVVGGGNCFINFHTLLIFHCVVRKLFLL